MIEVFKTNVNDPSDARRLVERIHATFPRHKANFDLQDCDKILRIETDERVIESTKIVALLHGDGFYAEILSDDIPVAGL